MSTGNSPKGPTPKPNTSSEARVRKDDPFGEVDQAAPLEAEHEQWVRPLTEVFSIDLEPKRPNPWESTISAPENPAPAVSAEPPADPESLRQLLFDDVKSAAPAAAPPPPTDASGPIGFDSLSPWPANIATAAVAEKLLKGSDAPEPLRSSIKRVQETLSPLERAALHGEVLPFDPAPLRNAVLVRWRLVAAIELQPASEPESQPNSAPAETESRPLRVDLAALEQLLTDADVALASLRAPDDSYEEIRSGFNAARAVLAKEAVRLAEASRALAHQAALEAADTAKQKYKHVSARLLSISSVKRGARKAGQSKALWISLAVSAAAAGVFHVLRSKAAIEPYLANVVHVGALTGVRSTTGQITVYQTAPDMPVNPAELQSLKAEAEASGKAVHEIAPNQFIVAPVELKIPEPPPNVPFLK